jgi:hypothetical protein
LFEAAFTSAPPRTAARTCSTCGANKYKTGKNRRTSCDEQPNCSAGQKMSADTKTAARTCSACGANTYKIGRNRATSCDEQPKCSAGQKMSANTKTAARTCSACGANTYQSATAHRITSCTDKGTCAVGTGVSVEGGATSNLTCAPCAVGTSFSSADDRTACRTDLLQCGSKQFESAAPTAEADRHCTDHRICVAGQYETLSPHGFRNRECDACPIGSMCDGTTQTDSQGQEQVRHVVCENKEAGPHEYQDEAGHSTCKTCGTCAGGRR